MVITFNKLGEYGRLGNQMFQYATLKSVGAKKGFEVKIPKGNYALKNLNLQSDIITDEESKKIDKSYSERFFHFDKNVFDIADNTNLFGYFQSYKYFDNIKESLSREFSVESKEDEAVEFMMEAMPVRVGVHVRRTDYLKFPNVHPFPGLDYYKKSFEVYRDNFACTFVVCSDDIKWCKENFVGDDFLFSESNDSIFDLMLLSNCDHNIIANSSFSWWGAYLNCNLSKIITSPNKWMGKNGPQDYYDLTPISWRQQG